MVLIKIIACIIMVITSYWLYQVIKARYVVRKFFYKAIEAEQLYGLFTLSKYGKISAENINISFEVKVTTEDIKYILQLIEDAISYCDKNCLREFEEPTLNEVYSNLEEMAVELRRWLWVNSQ